VEEKLSHLRFFFAGITLRCRQRKPNTEEETNAQSRGFFKRHRSGKVIEVKPSDFAELENAVPGACLHQSRAGDQIRQGRSNGLHGSEPGGQFGLKEVKPCQMKQ